MLLHAVLVVEFESIVRPPAGLVGLHSLDESINGFLFYSSHQSGVLLEFGVEEDDCGKVFGVDLERGDELGVAFGVQRADCLVDLCCDAFCAAYEGRICCPLLVAAIEE